MGSSERPPLHNGFSESQADEMAVAVSEAYTNVIRHARTSWVTLRYAVDPYAMTIEVEDDGEGFDLAILERFEAAEDKETLINDRKLRIKTLQATLEILREDLERSLPVVRPI